jgi:hypothetical protein
MCDVPLWKRIIVWTLTIIGECLFTCVWTKYFAYHIVRDLKLTVVMGLPPADQKMSAARFLMTYLPSFVRPCHCHLTIRADSFAPPHPTSIKRCISRVERNPTLVNSDLFVDTSCDTPLKEGHISILRADGPGLSPNEPKIVQVKSPSIPDIMLLLLRPDCQWLRKNQTIWQYVTPWSLRECCLLKGQPCRKPEFLHQSDSRAKKHSSQYLLCSQIKVFTSHFRGLDNPVGMAVR